MAVPRLRVYCALRRTKSLFVLPDIYHDDLVGIYEFLSVRRDWD